MDRNDLRFRSCERRMPEARILFELRELQPFLERLERFFFNSSSVCGMREFYHTCRSFACCGLLVVEMFDQRDNFYRIFDIKSLALDEAACLGKFAQRSIVRVFSQSHQPCAGF